MFNHFFSAFFRGENLTTLALPNEGKGNAFPGAGAGPAKPTLRSLAFTAGEEPRSEGSIIKLTAPFKNCGEAATTTLSAAGAVAP